MAHLLLVEDDPNLGLLVEEFLQMKGFAVDRAHNGEEGLRLFTNATYDLCLLDVMMPRKDGFTLAKEIRMTGRDVPIIFLTAKSQTDDTIQGFRAGADDYITKPFSTEELLLRIQAVLRRYGQRPAEAEPATYQIGTLLFDALHQTLTPTGGAAQKLTSKESALLKLLAQNLNQPVSRSFALKMVWGDDSYFNARSMDVYVTKLRKYLRDDPRVQLVNVHGEGFKLIV